MAENNPYKVLMNILNLKCNVTDFAEHWQKRKAVSPPATINDTVQMNLAKHQSYLKALCVVINNYTKTPSYFPAPDEILPILPFAKYLFEYRTSGDLVAKWFKTGVYQTLFGYDKSKCLENSYELDARWHIPGKTESGKPAFFLVCVYLFMVAMNIRAVSAATIAEQTKIAITDNLPIPMVFSTLFEDNIFKDMRKFYIDACIENKKILALCTSVPLFTSYLDGIFRAIDTFSVTLYTYPNFSDIMKPPEFTIPLSPYDSFISSTNGSEYKVANLALSDFDSLLAYTFAASKLKSGMFENQTKTLNDALFSLICIAIVPERDYANATKSKWTMRLHGAPFEVDYIIEIDKVIAKLSDILASLSSLFDATHVFTTGYLCNLMRENAIVNDPANGFKLNFNGAANESKYRWYCEQLMTQDIPSNIADAEPHPFQSQLLTNLMSKTGGGSTEAAFCTPSFVNPNIFGLFE